MLCTFWVRAMVPDGTLVASNFVQFFVDAGAPPWQQLNLRTVYRLDAHSWSSSEWNGGKSIARGSATCGAACGTGRGFFEWKFPVSPAELQGVRRITLLCEASSAREGAPQTDRFAQPSTLRSPAQRRARLPHHSCRIIRTTRAAALSYLRGGRGAYGYLCHATVEGELLAEAARGR